MDILVFNVGGVRYETLRSTIQGAGKCHLSSPEFLAEHFNNNSGEYFFDRDPDMFKAVLNYLRTGFLHLPSFICGPAAKMELEFWGLRPGLIERCCWTHYNDWNSTLNALKRFEHDRKSRASPSSHEGDSSEEWWPQFRSKVWPYLSGANGTIAAKIIDIFSLCFVLMSIFTFLAETTPPFHYTERRPAPSTISPPPPMNGNTGQFNETTTASISSTFKGTPETSPSELWTDPFIEVRVKHPVLGVFDIICLVYFTVEYIVRLTFAPRKLKHVTSLLPVIDLLAILPDYIEVIVYSVQPDLRGDTSGMEFMSTLRVVRVLRIFRLIRHVPGLWILVYTLRASFSELMLLVWFMTLGILVFSSLIYFTEDKKEFKTIPDGFWWALITMTTVGYGDMYPKTFAGKIVGSFCAMTGVLMIGFTVPTLVNNFMLYYKHVQFALYTEEQTTNDLDPGDNSEVKEMGIYGSTSFEMNANEKKRDGTSHECIPLFEVNENHK